MLKPRTHYRWFQVPGARCHVRVGSKSVFVSFVPARRAFVVHGSGFQVLVKLSELAARLGCRLEGDGNVDVTRVTGIQDAGPGDLTFIANSKYEKLLATTRASAVILREDGLAAPTAVLRARDPYLAFARAVGLFAPEWRPAAGHSHAHLHRADRQSW